MNEEIKVALASSINETKGALAEHSASVKLATESLKTFNGVASSPIVIIDNDFELPSSYIDLEPIYFAAKTQSGFSAAKPFACKGKHQYRQQITDNLSEWICQCGRKL